MSLGIVFVFPVDFIATVWTQSEVVEEIQVFKEELPELQKYRTQSPEVLAAALTLSSQFDDLKKQGCMLSSSREEFIDINLETVESV